MANAWSNNVTVIDGASDRVVGSITVGAVPSGLTVGDSNVYVANQGSSNVTVIHAATNSVVDSIAGGPAPSGLAYDMSTGFLFITEDLMNGTVRVVNTSDFSLVTTLVAGVEPLEAAFDSSNGNVYVTNSNLRNVTVINGSTAKVVNSLPAGPAPWGVVADNSNRCVYVTNIQADNGFSNRRRACGIGKFLRSRDRRRPQRFIWGEGKRGAAPTCILIRVDVRGRRDDWGYGQRHNSPVSGYGFPYCDGDRDGNGRFFCRKQHDGDRERQAGGFDSRRFGQCYGRIRCYGSRLGASRDACGFGDSRDAALHGVFLERATGRMLKQERRENLVRDDDTWELIHRSNGDGLCRSDLGAEWIAGIPG